MRVSIVATALDGQQPEAKSVINMVHRIHNRNPGYSDFSNIDINNNNLVQNNQSHITEGATALKLDNEIDKHLDEKIVNEEILNNETQNLINSVSSEEDTKDTFEDEISSKDTDFALNKDEDKNGLENFGIEEIEQSTPDLFNSDSSVTSEEQFTSFDKSEEKNEDEDDLEIPAFLRRQKN